MGNITNLQRWGNAGVKMDSLSYKYSTLNGNLASNKLFAVRDNVTSANYTDDIDNQKDINNDPYYKNFKNNYAYDELGNLKKDSAEGIQNIEWTVYGKIKKVTRYSTSTKPDLEFVYDASGNRICKILKPKPLSVATYKYSYYLRDAQGNEMANYELNMLNTTTVKDLTVTARPIYGSSRLGVDSRRVILWQNGTNVSTDTPTVIKNRILSMKQYELSNHLGNVLVTVSDKRIAKSYGGGSVDYFEPEITTISDYYAFGSPMPTRTWSDPNAKYKYGFNGKELDKGDEGMGGGGSTYDYGFRIYNPNLGRFLSVDPLSKEFPWNSSYAFAENDVLRCIDLEGAEKYVVIRCWDHGKFIGAICIYLPDLGRVRLYQKNHPATNSTMIINAELSEDQRKLLFGGDIFKKEIINRNTVITGLKDDVNNILFNTTTATNGSVLTRGVKPGTEIIPLPINSNEKELLVNSENIFNSGNQGESMQLPKVKTLNYNFNKSVTTELSQEDIDNYKNFLQRNPEYEITVTGYTDKKGSAAYNEALGLKRANDVKDYLISQGIDGNRIRTESKGEQEATKEESASNEDRESDRKVDIRWSPPKPTQ